jgi:hypothetical protein
MSAALHRVSMTLPQDLVTRLDALVSESDLRTRSAMAAHLLRHALNEIPQNAAVPHATAGAPGPVPGIAGSGAALQDPVAAQQALHAAHLRRHLNAKEAQAELQRQAKEAILKQLEE